jgi:hypothetical protein
MYASFSNDHVECRWAEEARLEASALSPADADRLQIHLSSCESCRREAEWDRRLAEALSACAVPHPPALAGVVLGRVQRQRLLYRAGWVIAAAAFLLGVGLGAWQLTDRVERPPTVENPPEARPADDDIRDVVQAAAQRPVLPLRHIDRQQDAVLRVLSELDEEF